MVDVEMEYPESKTKWQSFLNQIKNNQLPALPNESNERLSNFLSSKGIFNAYYDLKALQTSLSKRSFVAPFTGYVVNVYLQDGSFVTGNSKICDIAPTSKLEVDFNVSEEFASQLSVGSTVFVGDRASKIVRIGNQINNVTQQKKFTAQLLNVGGDLLAGDFVKIKIPLAKKKIEAMVLPVYCLDKNSLYQIQKDSSLTLKNITIVGEKNDSVFVSGLQKGDLILNEAFSNFKNGQKVRF
jgi:multidrug efflux pump subunit AcrA (membrane-fusion protein)